MFEGRTGGWRKAFVAGFHVAMQMAPAYAAHGADGFVADDAKRDGLWNAVRDVCREDAIKDEEHKGRAAVWEACGAGNPYARCRLLGQSGDFAATRGGGPRSS